MLWSGCILADWKEPLDYLICHMLPAFELLWVQSSCLAKGDVLQIIRWEHCHEMANSPDSQYFSSIVGQFKNFKMQFGFGTYMWFEPPCKECNICSWSLRKSTVWHPDRSELRLHRGLLPRHFSCRLFLHKCFKLPAQTIWDIWLCMIYIACMIPCCRK